MAQELFTYDWHMDDAPAIFQVDMAVPAEALSCRPYMLYIQGKSRKEALTPREERHLAALFKKAEKTLDALFVGSIHAAARQVFFFYTDDAEQGSQAKALIAQEKVLDCTAGLRDDPAGDTYHKLLYPDAARLFTQQNRQQIDLLKAWGCPYPCQAGGLSCVFSLRALGPTLYGRRPPKRVRRGRKRVRPGTGAWVWH